MLPAEFSSVLQAQTQEDFSAEVSRFSKRLGFDTFAAVAVVDHGIGRTEFFAVQNAPAGFQQTTIR
jgi:Autoinducer binding domain